MSATVAQTRGGLATRLSTIPGLTVYTTVPATPVAPCAVIRPTKGSYDTTIANGGDEYSYDVVVLATQAATAWDTAQELLDEYLARSGARSIRAAVQGDVSLGGYAHTCRVTGWSDYGTMSLAGADWFGVRFTVEVWPT